MTRITAPEGAAWPAERVLAADRAHVWHPYAPRTRPEDALVVRSARGTRLTLADGRELIDAMSSWWAACHGHGHPHLLAAAHRQLDEMAHVMFGGLTHGPAARLAERLVAFANRRPGGRGPKPALDSVFFSDSGSVAVEVAMKMALQAQRGRGLPERTRFLTWRGGYHGDTRAPMSVCDPEGGMHSLWRGVIEEQVFLPEPPARGSDREAIDAYLRDAQERIDRHDATHPESRIAALIVEPVVQGAGGMRFHDDELVAGLAEVCRERGILVILDEIATGFGRTGAPFVAARAGVSPDVLCVGKALTGGVLSFAATLATGEVARLVDSPDGGGSLMHGPTFMGNPLAAAVANAALDLVEDGYWERAVPAIEARLETGLEPLAGEPGIKEVRCLGAIGVVELDDEVDARAATAAAVEAGVWLRPFRNLVYAMPPFTCTEEEIDRIAAGLSAAALAGRRSK
ncbi:adenosylmethionine--8-amino-7-oxononanoate transaminase [Corynebacterium otitidis]|uniref:Adenosylmethionine-8-amino-7-oxononanoate aminotransferase n=1 Tax=Corynebacterium otitidis ATCC 51513 TaxID=883169 RepID=I7LB97_9CORY|nr:adenosylmethionine--8-amino-7-oxononanoate transaminase [Corynebacterium otitidis]EJZ82726.1 adenosylmethionine-8-amino-7-oxononanoate transaminase [Corynebacterium otitidis ATCC 51513]CCI82914.1 adenosylmethionine-8-amino-7-oxononanoatetransaminase [Corynebacterium otitidis ATCC 51513]